MGRVDSLVLKAAGEEAVRDLGEMFQTAEFLVTLETFGVTEAAALESLEVLDHDGYVELHRTMGSGLESMSSFALTSVWLEQYLHTYVDGYNRMTNDIRAAVANTVDQGTDDEIAKATSHPRLIVLHVLKLLDAMTVRARA